MARVIARLIAFAFPAALGLTAALLVAAGALAQSMPAVPGGLGLYFGLIPSASQWNGFFQAKQDWPLPAFTVATLPPCNSAIAFSWAVITDATTPTYNGTPVGSGAVIVPVFCTGAAWKTH